ncbi:MAG: ComEC/Rec2 family competence protein [Patescibacteria group bacterium]
MHIADAFFFGALAFLMGVLLSSAGVTTPILWATVVAELVCFLAWAFHPRLTRFLSSAPRKTFLAVAALVLLFPAGAVYYTWDDRRFRSVTVPFDREIDFSGMVVNDPVVSTRGRSAGLVLAPPRSGRILLSLPAYPEVAYGDALQGRGVVTVPIPDWYARYLAKERVSGVVRYADVERTASGAGSPIKALLYSLKHAVTDSFARVLPAGEAAFLSGLTIGERAEFSEEFTEAMRRSGTTHLVALSGYNITIVVTAAMGLFLYFLRRRLAFILTFLVVIGFVVMTGAEASVVRAAIIGLLILFAREAGRQFDIRNAIVAAGLAMVFWNPKVLLFDVGFQLSFLALLGIVYLEPALRKLFRVSGKGFLAWKENLMTTLAAQLAVAPLLITQFGSVSLTSLIANVLILSAVPTTMALGFAIAFVSFLSTVFASVLGLVAWVLLKFEMFVITLFSALALPLAPALGWGLTVAYYGALTALIAYARLNRTKTQEA